MLPSVTGFFANAAIVSGDSTDLNSANNSAQVTTSVSSSGLAVLGGTFVNGQFQLTISAQAGQTHDVQATTNLSNWVSLGSYIIPANGVVTIIDTNSPGLQTRYYRTVQHIP